MNTAVALVIGIGGGLILLVVVGTLLFHMTWRVAEPNQALIISGFKEQPVDGVGESMGFKIVTGKGVPVMPGFQKVRTLSLDANETELSITCVTTQGIPVTVKAVVLYKVGDDFVSISNAARRFLDTKAEEIEQKIKNVFEGHLRSIVGGLTVEQMIRDREALTDRTRSHSSEEMQKLGLVIDSLQIKEMDDPTGYIKSLAAPHTATVQKEARIAHAEADREATEREQASEALKAAARRDAEIRIAGFQAEIDTAQREATQAGPLAEQIARQRVVEEQTKVAELEARRREQALQAEVRKPADAEAYRQRTLAQAERDARISRAEASAKETQLTAAANAERVKIEASASSERTRLESQAQAASTEAIGRAQAEATKARGVAEAQATEARGLAEATTIKARAEALAVNQEAVIAQQLAEQAVGIVAAAAKPVGDIDNLVVLNGAEGIQEAVFGSIARGFTALQALRSSLMPTASVTLAADQNGRGDLTGTVEPPTPAKVSPERIHPAPA